MRLIPTLFALLLIGPVWAAVPTSLNYQAYLTDRDGSPEVGNTLITFSIYASEVGGSPLWFDTLNIDIENGLLSVQLGRPANPFPVDLFDTALWLGIAVESDGEMIPRRALTSVGFSFKSEDANSVQGKSAADLDQSAHTDDLANPHAVTAAQAGAADQAILDAHTGDTANPHLTTAAQTGATDAGVFSVHAADVAAHHSRYANSEAVSAVLAADGPGSSLDADTLDGTQAATFIDGIGANAADIADNSQAILDNASAITSLNGAPVVRSDGEVIGLFLSVTSGASMWVLSSTNYMFALGAGGQIITEELGFVEPDCQGQAFVVYVSMNVDFAMQVGWVLRAGGAQLFSTAPGSTSQYVNLQSQLHSDGTCEPQGDGTTAIPVFPNNPSVTGVSEVSFPPPITIGP